jgi:hypothetical protein
MLRFPLISLPHGTFSGEHQVAVPVDYLKSAGNPIIPQKSLLKISNIRRSVLGNLLKHPVGVEKVAELALVSMNTGMY